MAIDQQYLLSLARRITQHYSDAQLAIIVLLAARLRLGIDSKDWASKRLADAPQLQRRVERIVGQLQRHRAATVAAVLSEAYAGATAATTHVLARAGRRPTLTAAIEGGFGREGPGRAYEALVRDLEYRLASGDRRILRVSEDVYRQVIGAATQQGMEDAVTRRAVAQSALNAFADRGVTGFVDTAGRSWNLASYAEMACRTGVLSASRAGRLDAMRARGHDLAIISGNAAGCELCAPWEGQIVSIDGATPGFATLDDAEGAGLFHANCGHEADAFVPGVTAEQTAVRSDPEIYAARERQRQMERTIRAYKLRKAAALDDVSAARAQAKVREWQGKLRAHVDQYGLKRLYYREQVGKAI